MLGYQRLICADRIGWLVVGAFCTVVTMSSFAIFKQALLPERGFKFDAHFAEMGRLALGGISPWEVTHLLFGSIRATAVIDQLYTAWSLLLFTFPLLFPFLTRDAALRAQALIAWVLAWMLIGTVAAWALSSAGPCYYNDLIGPDASYRTLNERLDTLHAGALETGIAIQNISFQTVLLDRFREGRVVMGAGISAMPSMHVTMAVLIALAGWRISRPLGHVLGGYAVVIWIGSIHLGWHYAVDGPVALVLMLLVWRLSGQIVRAIAPSSVERTLMGTVPHS